jgi:hypothetical protein
MAQLRINPAQRPIMKVSGFACFEDLTAAGVRVLRDFEGRKLPGLSFTFGPSSGMVVVRWDLLAHLAVVARMAGMAANHRDNPLQAVFARPEFD